MIQQIVQKSQAETRVPISARTNYSCRRPEHSRLQLSQTPSNHVVLRCCPGVIQASLAISATDDRYEREADCVADSVMRMPESTVRRQTEEGAEEEKEPGTAQTKPVAEQITPLVQRQNEASEEAEENEEGMIQLLPTSPQVMQTSPQPSPMQAKVASVPTWGQLPTYAQGHLGDKGVDQEWFDQQTSATRQTILNFYVKLSGMGLWGHVGRIYRDESIDNPGCIHFETDIRKLKQDLRSRWNFRSPEDSDREWDSAEKRATGSLHFKHFEGWHDTSKVQAHIDQAGVWLGSAALWWSGLPVALPRHLLAYDSYKDVYGIRDILLQQGWDRQALLGVAASTVQRKALPASHLVVPAAAQQIDALRGRGFQLPASIRAFFEPRFGRDFSGVHVHTDPNAAESAQAIGALAYTLGRDVVFGVGQYAPESSEGRRLLAHELTHVAQQDSSESSTRLKLAKKAPKSGKSFAKPDFSTLWTNHPGEGSGCDEAIPDKCAIRMGEALDKSGFSFKGYGEPICRHGWPRGAEQLAGFLWSKWGKPLIKTDGDAARRAVQGKTGIIFFKDFYQRAGERTRRGDHIDLWNKTTPKNQVYFDAAAQVWFFALP